MHVAALHLQDFRGFSSQIFSFPDRVTAIVGRNAAGKTTILEALALLSTGESFRAEKVEEMIRVNQEIGRAKAEVFESFEMSESGEEKTELEVMLTRGIVQGRSAQSRLYSVNQVRRRKKDFVGKFLTVVFRPEDMRLIEGSPGRRRSFIDTVLATLDFEYAASLKIYEDSLRRRNRLLQQIRDHQMQPTVLSYWTNAVVKHGQIVQAKRATFLQSFTAVEFPIPFQIIYQPSLISADRLATYDEREIAAGHQLIGPHKDDFLVIADPQTFGLPSPQVLPDPNDPDSVFSVATYGSRGQQRLAVLWLKICEVAYLFSKTEIQPLLLLDDIFSELDEAHRQDVFSLCKNRQVIITSAEPRLLKEVKARLGQVGVIEL